MLTIHVASCLQTGLRPPTGPRTPTEPHTPMGPHTLPRMTPMMKILRLQRTAMRISGATMGIVADISKMGCIYMPTKYRTTSTLTMIASNSIVPSKTVTWHPSTTQKNGEIMKRQVTLAVLTSAHTGFVRITSPLIQILRPRILRPRILRTRILRAMRHSPFKKEHNLCNTKSTCTVKPL